MHPNTNSLLFLRTLVREKRKYSIKLYIARKKACKQKASPSAGRLYKQRITENISIQAYPLRKHVVHTWSGFVYIVAVCHACVNAHRRTLGLRCSLLPERLNPRSPGTHPGPAFGARFLRLEDTDDPERHVSTKFLTPGTRLILSRSKFEP